MKTVISPKKLVNIKFIAFLLVIIVVTTSAIAKINMQNVFRFPGINEVTDLVLYSFPAVKGLSLFCGVLSLGFSILVAFYIGDNKKGNINGEQLVYLQWAKYFSIAWICFSILAIPLDLANSNERSLAFTLKPSNFVRLFKETSNGKIWFFTALFALLAAITIHFALSWGTVIFSLFWTVCAFLPLIVSGHSAVGGNHDLATNGLLYHVGASAVWLGGLVAVCFYVKNKGKYSVTAIKRFSATALVCIILVFISGIINTVVRIDWNKLFSTDYGYMILIKFVLTIILGIFGFIARKFTIQKIENDPNDRKNFIQFVLVEISIFTLAFAIAIGLSQTPPPIKSSIENITQPEVILGYKLDSPPSFKNFLIDWRFDLIFGVLAIFLWFIYLYFVWKLKTNDISWDKSKIINWSIGCFLLLFITSSGFGKYSLAVFSTHMILHMFLSMVVPVFFVLGAPITLALRALPAAKHPGPIGIREWILLLLHSRYSKIITNPIFATIMFLASFYVLYFSNMFADLAGEHAGHIYMNIHFLMSGYIFYWIIIGQDPAPRKLSYFTKLMLLCISIPFHAMFGVIIMSMRSPIAINYYNNIDLKWSIDRLNDQHIAGVIAWISGEPIILLIIGAFFIQWFRKDNRDAVRLDRKSERNEESELIEYNKMLKQLNDKS